MTTTYLVENDKNEVLQYFKRLGDAKQYLEALNDPSIRLLCLKGQAYGEGYHAYQIVYHRGNYPGGVFLKTRLRII